jgi:hypothetical protein
MNRLSWAMALAGLLIVPGLVLWAVSIALSWVSPCPRPFPGDGIGQLGAHQAVSVWPPAVECVGMGKSTYWFEAHPWMWDASLGFFAVAGLVLLFGLIADSRARRNSTPAPPADGVIPS